MHDVDNAVGVGLEDSRKLIARDNTPDASGAGLHYHGRIHVTCILLDRARQAVGEDCLGNFEPKRAAKVLAKDKNSHGNGNFLRGDEILHGDEGLKLVSAFPR